VGNAPRCGELAAPVSMCRPLHKATNLAIDERLLDEALRVGGQRTKKDTVTQALEEYVQRRKQARILDLFGKVDFDPKYDHKRQRRRP
jgi:Arc/MetJ family transcription regulator